MSLEAKCLCRSARGGITMNFVEYKEHLYKASIRVDEQKDLQHHGVKGQVHGERRYQNLDGSYTPLGRIHYGIGMSREEMAAEREAEERRQEQIDYNRSKSIREMTDEELQNAVLRARNEQMFEKNMMDRSTNYLQSRNIEERLNMEYEQMQYDKSRLKAERFMSRVERLAQFGGNLANAYGKLQDARGKYEDWRGKKNMADQQEWISKQQEEQYKSKVFQNKKAEKEYEYTYNKRAKADADAEEENSIKKKLGILKAKREYENENDAYIKEAKKRGLISDDDNDGSLGFLNNNRKAQESGKSNNSSSSSKETKQNGGSDGDFKPTYEKKVGDTYVYSDKTKSKWESFKERRAAKKEAEAKSKREALVAETKRKISERDLDNSSTLNSYFNGKKNDTGFTYKTYADKEKNLYETSPTWKRTIDNAKLRRQESAKQERIKTNLDNNKKSNEWKSTLSAWGSGSSGDTYYSPKEVEKYMATNSKTNGGKKVSEAAYKRKKHIKHSEEETK